MKKIFNSIFGGSSENQWEDDLSHKALLSQQALVAAAADTALLAQDVTTSLKDRLEDYVSQINSTAMLLSDALLLVNSEGIIESFNPAAERIFGWAKETMLGQHISTLFKLDNGLDLNHSDLMESFCENVNFDNPQHSVPHEEFRGICRDGRLIIVDVSASKLARSDGSISYIILVRDVTKKVEAERELAALAAYNEQLLKAVNASQIGIVITDPNKTDNPVIFANKGFCDMTGYQRDEVLGRNMRLLVGELSRNYPGFSSLREAVIKGESVQTNVINYKKDGTPMWNDVHLTPVYEEDKLKYWIGIQYDVTDLKETQEELRESEQHFRAFGEASSEAMLIHGNNKILDWNPRLIEMTGFSNSEIALMNPIDLIHPLERESIDRILSENTPRHYETLLTTKSGDVIEVAVNAKPVEWNNSQARIKVIRDVTHYKEVENILRGSRERYRTVIDNTIDLVCCFNSELIITFANQTFWEYFDLSLEEVIGSKLTDYLQENDRSEFIEYLKGLTPTSPVRRCLHRVERQGEERWQDWIDRGIFDDDGNLIEYQTVSRDVTHYVKASF